MDFFDSTNGIITPSTSQPALAFLNGSCDLPKDYFEKQTKYYNFCVFAADGGANIALSYGIMPHTVIGDMDSLTPGSRKILEQNNCQFITFPSEKNKTDGELLLDFLAKNSFNPIHLFAATGKRTDQTLININLLSKFPQARIINAEEEIFCSSSPIIINNCRGKKISFLAATQWVKNLTLTGFKYPASKLNLGKSSSRAISNLIVSDKARVEFSHGIIIVLKEM